MGGQGPRARNLLGLGVRSSGSVTFLDAWGPLPCPTHSLTPKSPQNLLVLRLRQADDEAGEAVDEEGAPEAGLTQRDLLRWYFEYMVERGAVAGQEQGLEELVLAEKVLGTLIRREHVVMVVQTPAQAEGESPAEYGRRAQLERVLALNPNYSLD